MIKDILSELDRLSAAVMVEGSKPISEKIAYNAGLRIGVGQGVQRARQAIIDWYSRDSKKDSKL